MSDPMRSHELVVLARDFAVCRFGPTALVPEWADSGAFWSICRSEEELSIICEERLIPSSIVAEKGFSCLKVVGPLEFSVVGVLASLTAPLAASGLSVLAVSTFDTDYLLVRREGLPDAIDALRESGHVVQF